MRHIPWTATSAALCGLLLLPVSGCYKGVDGDDAAGDGTAGETEGGPAPEEGGVGLMGMRRLSRFEFDMTVRDLLGDDTRPATMLLPEDVIDPFDNDYTTQLASTVLIEGLETLAIDISTRLLADPPRRDDVVGCTPSGATDTGCMQSFVESFGRRALRRPLSDEELQQFVGIGQSFATQQGDFYEGVDVILRAFLQHPEFVYRVEIGAETNEPGVFRLNDFEVGTRLSYFIWGSTPDDELLDLAEDGGLGTPEDVRAAAEWMLQDPRTRDRIDRLHAMWLGYFQLPHSAELTTALREESRALVEKVVFEDQSPWTELFTATGTFVNDYLAQHYGMPAPGSDELVWVEYDDPNRRGILGHGTFLSNGGKFGDTSPTRRGITIRTRLFCQVIPPPPPDVNVDEPPTSENGICKWDRYSAHRDAGGSCYGCHNLTDPVGFGLEHYDAEGKYRTHEYDQPLTPEDETSCEIVATGDVDGMPYSGPAELANLLIDNKLLDACAVTQVYRFAMGHREGPEDSRYIDDLTTLFEENQYRFDTLMLELVSDDAFGFRREEEE